MAEIIVGAGLSGLIAAHAWPRAEVLESNGQHQQHVALLRFRSSCVGELVGIPFRQVTVHKGIYYRGRFRAPNIQLANFYSQKVLNTISDRSIWKLTAAQRYIAPPNFYEQLVESVGRRIQWRTALAEFSRGPNWISTIPLPLALRFAHIDHQMNFNRAPIEVWRYTIPTCDTFQTIYFPDPETPIYRASITGNVLIVETVPYQREEERATYPRGFQEVAEAFALPTSLTELGRVEQRYGKIQETANDAERKDAIFKLSYEHNVFSLGRFATWRNILLDDVVGDINVLRRMIRASDYDRNHQRNT